MEIDFDAFWRVGAVRIRANAPDPFAGLRGRAYISARKLDQRPLEKITCPADAEAKDESRENLIKAINKAPAKAGAGERFLFALTSPAVLNGQWRRERRWYPVVFDEKTRTWKEVQR